MAGDAEPRGTRLHGDGLTAPFPPDEYAGRLERIRECMARERIDLLYLTAPESLFYVHGYRAYWYQANPPAATSRRRGA